MLQSTTSIQAFISIHQEISQFTFVQALQEHITILKVDAWDKIVIEKKNHHILKINFPTSSSMVLSSEGWELFPKRDQYPITLIYLHKKIKNKIKKKTFDSEWYSPRGIRPGLEVAGLFQIYSEKVTPSYFKKGNQ